MRNVLRSDCSPQALRASCGIWQQSLNLSQNEAASANDLKDQISPFPSLRNGSAHLAQKILNPGLRQCSVPLQNHMHIHKKELSVRVFALIYFWYCVYVVV